MAVMRVEKSTNYTVMSNRHLDDTRLSLKAIGLLSKILRLPDDWDYTLEGLAHICKEGKDAIRSAIVELEQAGYIERRQTHAADGSFAGNEYIRWARMRHRRWIIPQRCHRRLETRRRITRQREIQRNQILKIPST